VQPNKINQRKYVHTKKFIVENKASAKRFDASLYDFLYAPHYFVIPTPLPAKILLEITNRRKARVFSKFIESK